MNARYCPCFSLRGLLGTAPIDMGDDFRSEVLLTVKEVHVNIRYRVKLSDELKRLISGGKAPVRRVKRAQILLAADARRSDLDIAASVGVGTSTVFRTKRRFVEG